MAHKTEGDCPIATAIFIKKQAEKQGVSLNKMIELYAEESERPIGTIRDWVWPQDRSMKNHTTSKPPKTQTKPEVKIQISDIAQEIKSGAVSDDHAKVIGDALADAITNGTCSKRVGTKVHTAVRKVNKNRKEVTVKDINNYQRLWKHVLSTSEGLQILADGSMPSPETEEEAEALKGIIMALPHLCLQTARMGVDLMEIHESLQKGETKNEKKYIDI